jgi:hypothetical protein
MNILLDAALDLAARGLPVFPCWHVFPFEDQFLCGCGKGLRCDSPGKHPQSRFCRNGLKDASIDPELIKHWWTWAPSANVGVATGRVVVLDVDHDQALIELEAKHGPLPPTWRARTGNGEHIYFAVDIEIRNSCGKLSPGVDVRGVGGYVIAPPSLHVSGKHYEWITAPSAIALAPLPRWLLEKMRGPNGANGATSKEQWRELVRNGVNEGQRNTAVARLAGYLFRKYVDPLVVVDLLRCWNAARCHPPLDESEVMRTIDSIAELEIARRSRP